MIVTSAGGSAVGGVAKLPGLAPSQDRQAFLLATDEPLLIGGDL
jgi:hypothetical protein